MMSPIERIVQESTPVSNSLFRFHPGIPVGMMKRNTEAQRTSQLRRLMVKGKKFNPDLALGVVVVPNGAFLYPVIGATRTEWAMKEFGPEYLLPAFVYPENVSNEGQAKLFLGELTHNPPGTATKHSLKLVAKLPEGLDVEAAIVALGRNKSVGALTKIRDQKNGATLLSRTTNELLRVFRRFRTDIPAAIITGTFLLVSDGSKIANSWSGRPPDLPLQKARLRFAQYGGKGTISQHASVVLRGKPRGKVTDK